MEFIIALLLGFGASFGAVLMPGMLNMSVVNCSLEEDRWAGVRYAGGITLIMTLQAGIAIVGANYLRDNPDIIDLLSWWAVPVLTLLAAFFFFRWYRESQSDKSVEEQREDHSVDRPFSSGISVALLNFIAIPYYFAIGSWLMSDGVLSTAVVAKCLFVIGTATGSMAILSGYAFGARWVDQHAHYITHHFHLLVGSLFVLLAGIQAYRIWG
ncbi:MAG: LysE family transporter [Lewinella sp.]